MTSLEAVPALFAPIGGMLVRELTPPRLFVHLSAAFGLSGFLSPNVLMLRILSVLSSLSALAYNMWNRLASPCFWNLMFMAINGMRIGQLLVSPSHLTLSADEERLYEYAFLRFGVSPRDFVSLLREADASWHEYAPGQTISNQGEPMPTIWYLVHGSVHVIRHGQPVSLLQPDRDPNRAGGWLGEFWDPNEAPDYWEREHRWNAGHRANEHSLVVAFNRKALHDAIAKRPLLRTSAGNAEVSDLWGKLRAAQRQQFANVYVGMEAMAAVDGTVSEAEASDLRRYAEAHPEAIRDVKMMREAASAAHEEAGHAQAQAVADLFGAA